MNLQDFRQKIPQLNGLSDSDALDVLQKNYYPTVDKQRMADVLGVSLASPEAQSPKGRTAKQTMSDLGITALKGAIGLTEVPVGIADILTGGAAGKKAEELGYRPEEAKAILDAAYSDPQKKAFSNLQQADGFMGKLFAAAENPSVIAHTVGESLPSMLAGGVAARGLMGIGGAAVKSAAGGVGPALPGVMARTFGQSAPLVAGAAGEGLVGAGSAAEQIRQQTADGYLTGDQSGLAAASGVATSLFGVLGGKVAQRLGIGDVDTMLAGAARDPVMRKGVVRSFLEGTVTEGALEELPQSISEQVLQNMALGKPLDEGVDHAAALGLLSGGVMGGGAGGLGAIGNKAQAAADAKAQAAAAAQAEADAAAAAIRANKQPGSGPLTNAVNAVTEADAQRVEVAGASAAAAIASATDLADAAPSITSPEGSAEFINPDFQARQQTLAEQMASPENREKVRARFGEDGLSQVLYYAQAAGRADIPAKTANNMLQVAERMMGEVLLQPLGGDAQLGGMVRDPLTLDAPEVAGAQPLGLGLDQTPSGRFTVDGQGNAMPETAVQQTEAELRAESLRDEQKLKDDEAAILGQQQTGVRNAPEAPLQPVRRTLTDTNTANMLGTASDPVSGLVTQRRMDADAAAQRKSEEDQRRFEQARSGKLLNVPETGVTQRPLSVERGMELVKAKANGRTLLPQDEGFLVALRKEMGDDAYARMAQVAKAPFLFKKQERTAIIKPNQDAIAAWDAANNQAVADDAQQPGDVLNPSGQPFKTKMAADLAAKKTPGAVVPVVGGFVVRPAPAQAAAPTVPPVASAPAPTAPAAPNKATPAPEAGPTNQGATNGQKETLLKAEQPTGAAAMVSGAPVADTSLNRDSSWIIREKDTGKVVMETFDRAKVDALNTAKYEAVPIQQHLAEQGAKRPSDTTNPGGFIEKAKKASGKAAQAPVAAQQTAAEAPEKNSQVSLSREDTKSIDQPSKMDGDTVSSLMPFNIAGQKSHLLAESIGGLFETAARTARRVIDAFGGAGTYTHYLRANGIAHDGDILNEFDSMRANAHRQIAKNPDAVKAAVTKFTGEIYAEIERLGLNDGDLFTSDSDAARKALGDWVRSRLEAHVLKEPAPGKTSLTMMDSPELAGMYLVLQKKAVNKIPFQAERTQKTGRIKIPGFLFVMTKGGEKPKGSRVKLGGTVSLFKQDAMVRGIHAQIDSAAQRVGGMDVRTGDGWALIANEARDGDLATVDTSYLNKVDLETGKVEETMNYSGDTEEDADPNTYKSKVEKYLLPAWGRGAKLLITNNWDDDVAAYLSSHGFDVRKEYRKGAKLEERTTGAAELIAINFDPTTGQLTPKNRGRDALASGVGRSVGGAATRQDQQRGITYAGANTVRPVAAGAEGQSDAVPRSGRGQLNPSTGAGKADARNAELTSVVRNGGNSTAVLTDIAKNSKNPAFRLVAKAILAKGLPFELRIRTDFTDGKVAHYSTDGHFVEFDPSMPFNLEQVLLHEAVHAVTSKYVASFGDSTPLGKELAALFKLAEQHAKKTGAKFYGLTNADEFLAEVMTNADFAQWLDTVPVPLQKSALSRFVRAVARFFGIQKADGAATQAMGVFERIMLAQSDLQAEASQRLSTSKDAAAVAQAYGVDTEEDGDTVYFGDAEVSLNREDNTYIVASENEFTPDHRAAVAWAENNGFTSELAKSPSSKLTPVESMLRDALEATGDMGAAKDMAYEALRRQGVAVKWQEVVDAAKKMGRGTRASKPGADAGQLPDTITVDGVQRPTTNSNGQLIHPSEHGVRNFWRWFADSKVVDDKGRPLVVYHGTHSDINVFASDGGMAGWFGPAGVANNYAQNELGGGYGLSEDASIYPAYLRLGKPLIINPDMNDMALGRDLIATDTSIALPDYMSARRRMTYRIVNDPIFIAAVKVAGYDGVVAKEAGSNTYAAFDSTQIKSATGNTGAFSPTDPDVRFSKATPQPRTPAATIRAAITKAYGNLLDKLEGKGLVTIAQTEREAIEAAAQARADKTGGDAEAITGRMMSMASLDVKYSANGNIEGFFDKQTGKSFLVADNLTAASAPGTLMHEVGIHMAADGKLEPLFKRAGSLLKAGTQNEFIQRVKARMARAGETSDEEAAAYIVTEYENDRAKAPITIGKWLADLTAAVRAWLFSKGVILKAEQLTVADIAAVARANARSMARGGPGGPGGGLMFSRAADMAGNAIDKAKQTADKAMGKDFPRAASMPDLNDDQRSLLGKVGASQSPASDAIKAATDRAGLKIRQGMVDRFAALKELDEKALGQNFIADSITNSAWVLAKMSSAGAGALNAMMKSGRIEMDAQQKVIGLKGAPNGGLTASLQKLGGPAEVERFFAWVAANRAEKLMGEGRENLFTPAEIAAGKTLNTGTTEGGKVRPALYSQVHAEFQQYRDDVLAIAEQAGIINSENRAMWRDEFYVPFYRVMEDDADRGRSGGNGLSRQEAYKKLKGGKQNLNDLMENTLMNFHHLLSASLKNQAAVQAIKNAEHVKIARKLKKVNMGAEADLFMVDGTNTVVSDKKSITFILEKGKKVFYEVDDPLVFESITTLADPGLNNTAVRVMGAFKRLFTNMTTATPQFIIANTFRDLLQASATSPTSKNIAKNLKEGIQSYRDEKTRAEMLASGGAFSFGHIYGMGADEVKESLQKTVAGAGLISSPSIIPSILRKVWDAWSDVTDLSENASRAATYTQNVDQMGKLRAAFEARDVMDFSQHGAWPAVRLLVRIVPFLNARLQGLDKLYRSGVKPSILTAMGKGTDTDKQAAARFAMVTGALTLATMALYLVNADDDEYKKLEEWQKDTYWFIRIGENAFFLPKPFEVGAIATMAERTLQQAMDDKATGKLFRERMWEMLMQTFAFNPTPQMFQPLIDVYANKDAFTGRDIESAGMERMSTGLRSRDTTTAPATALSAISRVFGDESAIAVSPVQADHLIKGYLGGVGATAAGLIDTMYRAATGQSSPDKAWSEYQPIRRFYRDLDVPVANTRYATLFYDGLKEANRVYADVMELQKLGRTEEAQALATEKRSVLQMRIALNAQQRRLTEINNRMKEVRRSDKDGEWKRRELDLLTTQKALITERLGKRIEDARATQ